MELFSRGVTIWLMVVIGSSTDGGTTNYYLTVSMNLHSFNVIFLGQSMQFIIDAPIQSSNEEIKKITKSLK